MEGMKCENCRYGYVSSGARTVTIGNMTFNQKGENCVVCSCENIGTLDLANNYCSSFEEKR
jgi:hypothetical protein